MSFVEILKANFFRLKQMQVSYDFNKKNKIYTHENGKI